RQIIARELRVAGPDETGRERHRDDEQPVEPRARAEPLRPPECNDQGRRARCEWHEPWPGRGQSCRPQREIVEGGGVMGKREGLISAESEAGGAECSCGEY